MALPDRADTLAGRRPLGRQAAALGVTVLAVGSCVPPSQPASLAELRTRAAFDLGCPAQLVQVFPLDALSGAVAGCGRRAVYVQYCAVLRDSASCTWRAEPALVSSPPPLAPAPPSAMPLVVLVPPIASIALPVASALPPESPAACPAPAPCPPAAAGSAGLRFPNEWRPTGL